MMSEILLQRTTNASDITRFINKDSALVKQIATIPNQENSAIKKKLKKQITAEVGYFSDV